MPKPSVRPPKVKRCFRAMKPVSKRSRQHWAIAWPKRSASYASSRARTTPTTMTVSRAPSCATSALLAPPHRTR